MHYKGFISCPSAPLKLLLTSQASQTVRAAQTGSTMAAFELRRAVRLHSLLCYPCQHFVASVAVATFGGPQQQKHAN